MRTTITRMKCDGCSMEVDFKGGDFDSPIQPAILRDTPDSVGWTRCNGYDACPKCSEAVQRAISGILGGKV